MDRRTHISLLLFLTLSIDFTWADSTQPQRFESTINQTAMIELYTSQGCSSCPPADRWLSSLKTESGLWSDIVPLAFHVDYWDYIGWRDPFASKRYSNRQRDYAREGGARVVYTPGMMLNGEEWRAWRNGSETLIAAEPVGRLVLEYGMEEVKVEFIPQGDDPGRLKINLALLGFDLTSEVTSGENRGRALGNDFIVLEWAQKKMKRDGERWSARLDAFHLQDDVPRFGVAAWVSVGSGQAPVQATGGWLHQP